MKECADAKIGCKFVKQPSVRRQATKYKFYCRDDNRPEVWHHKTIIAYKDLAVLKKKAEVFDGIIAKIAKFSNVAKGGVERLSIPTAARVTLAEMLQHSLLSVGRANMVMALAILFFVQMFGLSEFITTDVIEGVVPSREAFDTAVKQTGILTDYEAVKKLKDVQYLTVSCDEGNKEGVSTTPITVSFLDKRPDGKLFPRHQLLQNLTTGKGGARVAASVGEALEAFGVFKGDTRLVNAAVDGAPDMKTMAEALAADYPDVMRTICSLHTLSLIVSLGFMWGFGFDESWEAPTAARLIYLVPYCMRHFEVELAAFEKEKKVTFVKSEGTFSKWWSVIRVAGQMARGRELLIEFLTRMGNNHKSPTFSKIAFQTAVWFSNDVLWSHVTFLCLFCENFWNEEMEWHQDPATWMLQDELEDHELLGGFRASEMPRRVVEANDKLEKLEERLEDETDATFAAFRECTAKFREDKPGSYSATMAGAKQMLRVARETHQQRFEPYLLEFVDCALDDPDDNVRLHLARQLLKTYDDSADGEVGSGMVFIDPLLLVAGSEQSVADVVEKMTRLVRSKKHAGLLRRSSVVFSNPDVVADVRHWVEEYECSVDYDNFVIESIRLKIRTIRTNTHHDERMVALGAFSAGVRRKSTGAQFKNAKATGRANFTLAERRKAQSEVFAAKWAQEGSAGEVEVGEMFELAKKRKERRKEEKKVEARGKGMIAAVLNQLLERQAVMCVVSNVASARKYFKELVRRGIDPKSRQDNAVAAVAGDTAKHKNRTPGDVRETADGLDIKPIQSTTDELNLRGQLPEMDKDGNVAKKSHLVLGALGSKELFVSECEARGIPLERAKSGKLKQTMTMNAMATLLLDHNEGNYIIKKMSSAGGATKTTPWAAFKEGGEEGCVVEEYVEEDQIEVPEEVAGDLPARRSTRNAISVFRR